MPLAAAPGLDDLGGDDVDQNLGERATFGIAVEVVVHHSVLTPEWRLFIITGFLGGLTTFSTFSAEAVNLLSREEYGWAMALIFAHLVGSISMTLLGIATVRALA